MDDDALQILAKWRVLYAGWQLGTRPKGDPESDAVCDHRELSMLMRAELNALAALLLQKGVFTATEWDAQCCVEAEHLSAMFEQRFPGVTASTKGLTIDVERAMPWMSKWKP